MPSPHNNNIDNAFVKHYEAEVHSAYQRMGSKLRNTVRSRNNIRGHEAIFQVIDKGVAQEKNRGSSTTRNKVPLMNIRRSTATVSLANYYAGAWIDALEELFTSTDEKMVNAQAGAYALGRKTDELIIDALQGANESGHTIARGSTGLTRKKVLDAFEQLGKVDVPDDGQRFAVVGWKQWSELLSIQEFASADYVGSDELPWKGTQAKQWLGTLWMPHSGLKFSNNTRSCFWYHRTAVGHAIGKDITTDITWHGDYAAHFVNNMMSQGAGVIDNTGIVKIECYET